MTKIEKIEIIKANLAKLDARMHRTKRTSARMKLARIKGQWTFLLQIEERNTDCR